MKVPVPLTRQAVDELAFRRLLSRPELPMDLAAGLAQSCTREASVDQDESMQAWVDRPLPWAEPLSEEEVREHIRKSGGDPDSSQDFAAGMVWFGNTIYVRFSAKGERVDSKFAGRTSWYATT